VDYIASLVPTSSDTISGAQVITTLDELYKIFTKSDTSLVTIKSDFAEEYFTPSGLASLISSARRINKYIRFDIPISYQTSDDTIFKQMLVCKTIPDINKLMLMNPKGFMDGWNTIMCKLAETKEEALEAND